MKIRLPGEATSERVDHDLGELGELLGARVVATTKQSATGRGRGHAGWVTSAAPEDVLELTWEGDVIELVRVDELHQRFPGQQRSSDLLFSLPTRHTVTAPTRGSEELLLESVKHLKLDALSSPVERAAEAIVAAIEARKIPTSGVHRVTASGQLDSVERNVGASPEPLLVLVHGTFSDTRQSFEDLFASPEWPELVRGYPDRLFALQQRTLSTSPVANAVELVSALPEGARLHLLTYSRGGLVGELLSRFPWDASEVELRFADERYGAWARDLQKLHDLLSNKRIRLERHVRVACPAGGTLLASTRLDRYLNVLLSVIGNVLGVGGPAFAFVKALALAIVGSRTRADRLPGLEAMMPHLDHGLVPFLNACEPRPSGGLAVIAGDVEGGSIFQRIKAFFSDLYYREDNDFVVDSKSMFRGVPRTEAVGLYYRGARAHHFGYFSEPLTRSAATEFLLRGQSAQLRELSAEDPYGGLRRAAARGIKKQPGSPSATDLRPVVFLLPGIMGTHLAEQGKRIWCAPWQLAWGGLARLGIAAPAITPDGLFERYYESLYTYLGRRYRVEPFPFDWRHSIARSAQALGAHVQKELATHSRPIRFIAHSMGGLVARTLIQSQPELWKELTARGGRLVMLGTPNHGSFVPVQVLARRHKLMHWLATLDVKNKLGALTEIVGSFPGLIEMLPQSFLHPAPWQALGLVPPSLEDLEAARRFREQLADGMSGVTSGLLYVAGKADETVASAELQGSSLEVRITRRGDGTVPWDLGLLPGVPTYYVNAEHGEIPGHEPSFPGFLELLETGRTNKLTQNPPIRLRALADDVVVVPARALEEAEQELPRYYPGADDLLSAVMGPPFHEKEAVEAPVTIRVINGDVRDSAHPVLVGHYVGDKLVSVERALDQKLGGALSRRHALGAYPGELGTALSENGVLVVGLGAIGELTPAALEQTVTEALVEHALCQFRTAQPSESAAVSLAVASVLIGTYGGSRLTVESSLEALTGAVLAANRALSSMPLMGDTSSGMSSTWGAGASTPPMRFERLDVIELYQDMAAEAARAAARIAQRSAGAFVAEPRVQLTTAARRSRPRSPYASGWSRRVAIHADGDLLRYEAFTDLARSEPEVRRIQWRLLEPVVSDAMRADGEARSVLLRYLLPPGWLTFLSRGTDLALQLDQRTAQLPWELLGPSEAGTEPLGVRFGVIRQLSAPSRRPSVTQKRSRRALVIGNPAGVEPALEGAVREAEAVAALFRQHQPDPLEVVTCIDSDPEEIFRALLSADYDFIHVAAHGEFDPNAPERSGVLLADGLRLTAEEFDLPHVPLVVFLNCCHLGSLERPGAPRQPGQLAASLAGRLIEIGVRVVVVAGWAVDDLAAQKFATTLYAELLAGRTLIDSLRSARRDTFRACRAEDVTWGAYQVYGSDGFVLPETTGAYFAGAQPSSWVAPDELVDYLTDFVSRTREVAAANTSAEEWAGELHAAIEGIPEEWQSQGEVAFALGMAYAQLLQYDRAIEWLERALRSSNAPLRTLEELARLEVAFARVTVARSPETAETLFDRAVKRVELLLATGSSFTRHVLLANLLLSAAAALPREHARRPSWLERARAEYEQATELAPSAAQATWSRARTALLRLAQAGERPSEVEITALLESARETSEGSEQNGADPDVWSVCAAAELGLLRYALADGGTSSEYLQAVSQRRASVPCNHESRRDDLEVLARLADGALAERLTQLHRDVQLQLGGA